MSKKLYITCNKEKSVSEGFYRDIHIVVLIISAFQLLRSIAVVEGVSFEVVGTA
jgi:hypothetical protein